MSERKKGDSFPFSDSEDDYTDTEDNTEDNTKDIQKNKVTSGVSLAGDAGDGGDDSNEDIMFLKIFVKNCFTTSEQVPPIFHDTDENDTDENDILKNELEKNKKCLANIILIATREYEHQNAIAIAKFGKLQL